MHRVLRILAVVSAFGLPTFHFGAKFPAMASRRRDRDGEYARPRHLAALRDPSRRPEGEILRAVVPAFEHHAAIPVRGTVARERQADGRHSRHPARLQHRRDRERRSQSAGNADGRLGAFRGAARGVGRQERVSVWRRNLLRRVSTSGGETDSGFAAQKTRHRQGAADHHERRAARRQGASRARQRHGGWRDNWQDPDTEKFYYTKGPGLSYDAAKYIEGKAVVLVALDNPFTDPAPEGFVAGKAPPAAGTPPGLPFAIHHHNLTQAGIHNIQNANLGAMARDKVWLSCTIILPLRTQGAAGSPVRPVAIGAPAQ